MPVELKVAGSNPGVVHFFFPFLIFFSPFLFSLSFFFLPWFPFFSSPFHYPLQARSATSMLKHFSSKYDNMIWYNCAHSCTCASHVSMQLYIHIAWSHDTVSWIPKKHLETASLSLSSYSWPGG